MSSFPRAIANTVDPRHLSPESFQTLKKFADLEDLDLG